MEKDNYIKLKCLNMRAQFKGNEVVVLTGHKEGGKTTTIFSYLNWFCDILWEGMALCASDDSKLKKAKLRYKNIMPPIVVHTTHDPKKILAFIRHAGAENVRENIERRRFVVVDDFSQDKRKFKSQDWTEIITTARHAMVTVIVVLHSLMYLSEMRDLVEYIFLFSNNNVKRLELYWKEFASVVEDKRLFLRTFRHYTAFPRTSLVINCKSSAHDPRDCIFWYQPPIASTFNFTVCLNPELWRTNSAKGTLPNPPCRFVLPQAPRVTRSTHAARSAALDRRGEGTVTYTPHAPGISIPQAAPTRWIEAPAPPKNKLSGYKRPRPDSRPETEFFFTEGGKKGVRMPEWQFDI